MVQTPFPNHRQGGDRPLPAGTGVGGTGAGGAGAWGRQFAGAVIAGDWPTWLNGDDFDGLGEDGWLASLADQEAEDAGPLAGDEPAGLDSAGTPDAVAGPDRWFGPGGAAETMAPGIGLAMLVEESVEGGLTGLSDAGVVGAIAAARRLQRRAEWLELEGTREFARRRWEATPEPARDANGRWRLLNSTAEQAPAELAFELTEDRRASEDRMDLALSLRDRFPRLDALMSRGLLDERRCRGVRDMTAALSDDDARIVDQMLEDDAADLRYGQLLKRATKLALMLDPESVRERKEKATKKKARVEKFSERSGNYAFAARELPAEQALASEAHIRGLARFLRRNGVQGSLRDIEVMCFLDLTQGRDPRERIPGWEATQEGNRSAGRGPSDHAPGDNAARDNAPADDSPAGARGYDDSRDEPQVVDRDWREEEGWRPEDWWDYDSGDDDDDDDDGRGSGGDGGSNRPSGPAGPGRPGGRAPFPANINLLVPAGTGYGWSAMPGEAGGEVIDPQTLRDMIQAASRHPSTRWCVTLVDTENRTAIAHGCGRGRHHWDPPPEARGSSRARDGTPTADQLGQLAEFLARLKITFQPIATEPGDHEHHEQQYRPSRRLQHLIRARNATCPAPGCGASSHHTDLDHTTPWPDGPTAEGNLGPTCRRDHRTKQAPGWTLEQAEPGVFTWTTPAGRSYTTRPTKYDI
jgi:hypothetical protein